MKKYVSKVFNIIYLLSAICFHISLLYMIFDLIVTSLYHCPIQTIYFNELRISFIIIENLLFFSLILFINFFYFRINKDKITKNGFNLLYTIINILMSIAISLNLEIFTYGKKPIQYAGAHIAYIFKYNWVMWNSKLLQFYLPIIFLISSVVFILLSIIYVIKYLRVKHVDKKNKKTQPAREV